MKKIKTINRPTMANDLLQMEMNNVSQRDGELQMVKGLTEHWLQAIRIVFMGQSDADLKEFDLTVGKLLDRGYQLTSLVADLRYTPQRASSKKWSCEVRPKIGAKPGRIQ